MQSLRRTRVGNFCLEKARTLGQLQQLMEDGRLSEALYPVDSVFREYPALHILKEFQRLVDNGNPFFSEQTEEKILYDPGSWVRVYRMDESFAGIYAFTSCGRRYKPVKMFL